MRIGKRKIKLLTFNTKITLYNAFVNERLKKTEWFRTVIDDCSWQLKQERSTDDTAQYNSDKYICRIIKNPNYRTKSKWDSLPDNEKADCFTFAPGDMIFKGEISDAIDENISGHRANDIMKRYVPFCFAINQIKDNTGTGILEHYCIKGGGKIED